MLHRHLARGIFEDGDIRRRRIWMVLQRCKVLLNGEQRLLSSPSKYAADIQIFVGVHFNVEQFRIAGHRCACGKHSWLPLWADTGGMHVRKVHSPLFPTRGDEIGSNETQQSLPIAHRALTEQNVSLVDAVD